MIVRRSVAHLGPHILFPLEGHGCSAAPFLANHFMDKNTRGAVFRESPAVSVKCTAEEVLAYGGHFL